MDELDSLFEGEMASINEMFQEFEIKDKQNKKRQLLEQEDLKRKVCVCVCVCAYSCVWSEESSCIAHAYTSLHRHVSHKTPWSLPVPVYR